MIRVTIFNSKRIFKHIKFLVLFVIYLSTLIILHNHSSESNMFSFLSIQSEDLNITSLSCLEQTIPGISTTTYWEDSLLGSFETVIYSELPILNSSFIIEQCDESSNENIIVDTVTEIEYASDNVSTQVIDTDVPNTYTNNYNGVEIKNGTSYSLTEDILDYSTLNINTSDVIIFHTHTCESYTQSDKYQYEESGTFRTTNLERSVSKVGNELATYLLSYGYNVMHDTTYHDYPAYSGSYGRSMATVESLLLSHPNTDIIIDLHRDAIEDTSYAPSVKIDDEMVSQLMFVIGTDGGGLEHPNWHNNLKFAIKVQEKANELYPGLFKPIVLRNSRYNQQLGNAACIIEVGATGNTLDQSILSMKYLSKVLDESIKN